MSERKAVQAMFKHSRRIVASVQSFAFGERLKIDKKVECDDPYCPGWAVFNDAEIQRCDQCSQFEDDDQARAEFDATLARAVAFFFMEDGEEESDDDGLDEPE